MRRVLLPLGLIAFLLGAAGLTLGPPQPGRAWAFFGGGVPTDLAAESVMVVLAWLVIAVAVVCLLAGMFHAVDRRRLQSPLARATMLLTASLVLVIVGAVHRSIPPAQLCCGSNAADIREAIRLAQ